MIADFLSTIPAPILEQIQEIELKIESPDCDQAVAELLERTVLVGGKRLRPLLTYLMGDLVELDLSAVTPLASSIELVHAASLAHDDVIDEATTRRGMPSINQVGGNKQAVLAGDFLLADVIVRLTETGQLKLVKEMSLIIQDLAQGEWIQADAAKYRSYNDQTVHEVAMKKTASVMSWCTTAPLLLAGLEAGPVAYARSFGQKLGLAFQLMDDTLDFSENSQKDHHLDLKNGVVNGVLYRWLKSDEELWQDFKAGKDLESLWSRGDLSRAISQVRAQALSYLDEASELLDILVAELPFTVRPEKLRPIKSVIHYLGNRNH